jgi:uncharacterized protein with NRDE domain
MSVNAGESSLQNNPAVYGTWDGLSRDSKESSVLDKYKLAYRMNEEIDSTSSETLVRIYHTSQCLTWFSNLQQIVRL